MRYVVVVVFEGSGPEFEDRINRIKSRGDDWEAVEWSADLAFQIQDGKIDGSVVVVMRGDL